jgi:hypothetical protein
MHEIESKRRNVLQNKTKLEKDRVKSQTSHLQEKVVSLCYISYFTRNYFNESGL